VYDELARIELKWMKVLHMWVFHLKRAHDLSLLHCV
jgi:hypothetical protein